MNTDKDIRSMAEEYEPYIIDRRRYYHAHPELSGEEKETRAQIRRDLEAMGIHDIQELSGCYGMVATIHGGKPGKTIGLRADIDALNIEEKTGLPYASGNGNMHACGHDAHIAMLLGAARILNDMKQDLSGNIRLLIEPGEETDEGAKAMIREGVLEGLDALYGAHIWGDFDAPLIDVTPGNRMAGNYFFKLHVDGVAAHGSAPHLGVDAIAASAAIINNLQQYVSRINNPVNPLVLTIATINGGTRFNVIPNHVTMEGSLRTFSTDNSAEEIIRRIAGNTAAAFKAKATLEWLPMARPLINRDPLLNLIARNAVIRLYGEEGIGHLPTMMSSEDFAHFGQVPYFFAYIGSRNIEKGITYTNHHERYTIDEDVLKRGAAVMAQFAADYLTETAC